MKKIAFLIFLAQFCCDAFATCPVELNSELSSKVLLAPVGSGIETDDGEFVIKQKRIEMVPAIPGIGLRTITGTAVVDHLNNDDACSYQISDGTRDIAYVELVGY
ncbi:hypothetical protein [Candidatus Hydrogenosomobacter endosymbioticus]|uniref:Uncharacterized protein n=1 Tax=Candidatus Hydrogenosomobacter endosymbioticus TaxID=2558174 RepID=A0ABM7V8D7_9PROT|nr:hypothetical protein [Candidatus Hydrogenosomobacter endosymbioticus]BDB96042.1 hypothetical protein HYD_1750 [Candidatus Hydrogenosomobacter endosymbioticus]